MPNVDAAPNEQIVQEEEKVWLGLLLAWSAGGVDAVGFLVLLGVFTSHMTGNSTGAGIDLAHASWQELLLRAFPIPLFLFGVALGAALTEAGIRWGEPRILSLILTVEALVLLICLAYGDSLTRNGRLTVDSGVRFYLLVALPSLAMGMQNVSVRRVGGRAIHTTYMTGALTNAAEAGVRYLFWRAARALRRGPGSAQAAGNTGRPFLGHFVFSGAIWIAYVFGATLAALAEQHWQLDALALPLAGLVLAASWNLRWPIYERTPATIIEAAQQG